MLQALGFAPASWINLHAGHDEASDALRRIFKDGCGRVFDIFSAAEMTEPSIARARRLSRCQAEPADYRRLPLATGSIDVATLLLAAHELRSDEAMGALFS